MAYFEKDSHLLKLWVASIVLVCVIFIVAAWPEPEIVIDAPLREGNAPSLRIAEGATEGVILVHGFGASPWEMQLLADYLYQNGYTVYNVRLAGHGTTIEDFRRTTWQQWYQSVHDAYEIVDSISEHVYAIGLSTGGALCLLLAENEDLDGVIAVNAPIYLRDKMAKFSGVGKYFINSVHKDLEDYEKPYVYDTRPITAVHQLVKLMSYYKDDLGKIDEKLLIVQSKEDVTVDPESAYFIYDNVNSDYKQMMWYDTANHGITRTEDKDKLYPDILNFLKYTPVFN